MRKFAMMAILASTELASPAFAKDHSWYIGEGSGGARVRKDRLLAEWKQASEHTEPKLVSVRAVLLSTVATFGNTYARVFMIPNDRFDTLQ